MPEPTIKRRRANTRDRELADEDGRSFPPWPSWSTLFNAPFLILAIFELRDEALRLGHELLRGTKYEEER
jgi:hypothetical protein